MPGGDLLNFNVSKTYLGGDVGLDVRGPSGWTIGAKGFIDGSNDTTVAGGMAMVKILFNYGAGCRAISACLIVSGSCRAAERQSGSLSGKASAHQRERSVPLGCATSGRGLIRLHT